MKKDFILGIILIVYSFGTLNAQWNYTGGPYAVRILSFANSGNKILAQTVGGSGIFASDDLGANWKPIGFDFSLDMLSAYIITADEGHIFASRGREVSVSTDGGNSWNKCNLGLAKGVITTLLLDKTNLFAGTDRGEVFLSTDFGASWNSVNNGMSDPRIFTLFKDGVNIYSGGERYLYRSSDNGKNWVQLKNCSYINAIVRKGDKLFAAASRGVKVSTDNGSTWVNAGPNNSLAFSLAAFENKLFIYTNSGVFHSTDDGASWSKADTGLMEQKVSALFSCGEYLYAGTEIGVFRLHRDGTSWSLVNSGFTNGRINYIRVSGTQIFALTNFGIFHYNGENRGWDFTEPYRCWGPDNLAPNKDYGSINSFLAGEKDFFIGTDEGIFTSTDFGRTWSTLNQDLANSCFFCMGFDGTNLYFESELDNDIYILDKDKNCTKITPDLPELFTHFLELYGTEIFYVSKDLLVSKDKGKSWTAIRNNLPENMIKALVKKGPDIFVGMDGSGVFRSTDGGLTWTSVNSNLPNKRINSLLVCNNKLYCGTEKGVYLSTDNGANWKTIDPAFTKYVTSLAANDKSIFAGTWASGVWSIPISDSER